MIVRVYARTINPEKIDSMTNEENILLDDLYKEKPAFLQEDEWFDCEVENDWLNQLDPIEYDTYSLSIDGKPCCPFGGIHAMKGQPGHGKSMTFTMIMAAIIKGSFGRFKYEGGELYDTPTVLYIDTEMEKANTQLVMRRVFHFCDWQIGEDHSNRWRALRLRNTESALERWKKTLKAIWTMKPTVVFIDGLLDIVSDFNSNEECANVIYKCMKIADYFKMSVWCLVHENPGGEKMVGHLGSILERKVTDVFKPVKKKNDDDRKVTFEIQQNKARAEDIFPLTFHVERIDDGSKYGLSIPKMDNYSEDSVFIEKIRKDIEDNCESIEWPATAADIKKKIFSGGNDKRQESFTAACNRRFFIAEQIEPGKKFPKWNLNQDEFPTAPF